MVAGIRFKAANFWNNRRAWTLVRVWRGTAFFWSKWLCPLASATEVATALTPFCKPFFVFPRYAGAKTLNEFTARPIVDGQGILWPNGQTVSSCERLGSGPTICRLTQRLDITSEKPPSNAVCPTPNTPGTLSRPAGGPPPKRNRTCVELEGYHLRSCQTSPPPG